MCRDGAEGASPETSSVDVDRVFDHVVGRYALALVFWMWLTRIGQIKGGIEFLGSHRRVGGIDDNILVADGLQEALGVDHVRLFLDVTEILCLGAFVAQALFVAVEHDVVWSNTSWDVGLLRQIDGLWDVCYHRTNYRELATVWRRG